jgi:hypothetical protein
MSLVSVLGCGIWFFPIEEQLYLSSRLLRKGGYVLYSHFHPIYGAGKGDISDEGITIRDYWGERIRKSENIFGRSANINYEVSWKYYLPFAHF